MKLEDIVIVGGGSAGWLTALYVKKIFPEKNIIVIESSEIGILGAGEGTTPHFASFIEYLDIKIEDLIKNCEATIKNGIKFTNWNNDNEYFYHSFWPNGDLNFDGIFINRYEMSMPSLISSGIKLEDSLNSIDFAGKISELNKVPFAIKQGSYEIYSNYALHFNASKLAIRLKEIGCSRGIKCIDSKIKDFSINKNNHISKIILEDNSFIKTDFVFDCSGFYRLIIGNKLNSKWKSYHEKLPVDSALPFFIKIEDTIPPYTEAIAMKYGWMWKIPLQSRYGCGYVYDSSLINEKEAAKEIEEFLGFEPEYPRKNKGSFKFKAGYYEQPWIGNCIAIGLSAGFIEPLEATSIWVSIQCLERILSNPEFLYQNNKKIRNDFNKYFIDINEQVLDFIYFHYMSKRKDTKFWEKFTISNATKNIKDMLSIWDYRLPKYNDTVGKIWATYNWFSVAVGIKQINKSLIEDSNKYSKSQQNGLLRYKEYKEYQDSIVVTCLDHKVFIENAKNV